MRVLNVMFSYAQYDWSSILACQKYVVSGDTVFRWKLGGMSPPAAGPAEPGHWLYVGMHCSTARGSCDILRDRRLRSIPPPEGAGAIFGVACIGTSTEEILRVLALAMKHHKNTSGFIWEFRFRGKHLGMPSGGYEVEASTVTPRLCVHRNSQSNPRWVFHEDGVEVVALWTHARWVREVDLDAELQLEAVA